MTIKRARHPMAYATLTVLVAAQGGYAQEPEPLTLTGAVESALASYPSVGAARARSEEAAAAAAQARAEWFPNLSLIGAVTRFGEPMSAWPLHRFAFEEVPPFERTLIRGGAGVTYTLFDGGGRSSRIRAAEGIAESAEWTVRQAEQSLIADVVTTYLRVLTEREILAAIDRRLGSLRAERGRVRQTLEVGRAARVELLRIEAALASGEAQRVRVASALGVAERDLARLVGARPEAVGAGRLASVALTDSARLDLDSLAQQVLRTSPRLEAARQQLVSARAVRGAARSVRWPRFDLVGAWQEYGSAGGEFNTEWNVALELSYPIFTGGELSQGIGRAEAEVRAARDRLRLEEKRALAELDRVVSGVLESRARVRSLELAVARSAEVARIELLALEAGSGTQTDYLDAEASTLEARASLVEARHARIGARAELARVLGRLDMDWLRSNLGSGS